MSGQSFSKPHQKITELPGENQRLSSQQAQQAAYRFVARYYDYERLVAILRLLEAFPWTGGNPDSNEGAWAAWQSCVQETLDGAQLPELPPPWDS